MSTSYKVPSTRAPSSVSQAGAGKRIASPDGKRWAISRNQKRALPNRQFDVVECWTLKERGADGKARTAHTGMNEAAAVAFVNGKPA